MTYRYQHTQVGWVTLVALGLALLLVAVVGAFTAVYEFDLGAVLAEAAVGVLLLVCLALFSTLTVSIGEDMLVVRFGPGLVRKSFPLKEIQSCQVVRTWWWDGWGIHYTRRGWLFNVSGFGAVEVTMRNGKKYVIGTDEPKNLEQAIRRYVN